MTSEAKVVGHTPGPWRIEGGAVYVAPRDEFSFIGEKIAVVAYPHDGWVEGENGDMSHPEAEANARLLRAAPDLLDALREIAQQSLGVRARPDLTLGEINDIARAAIARATEG